MSSQHAAAPQLPNLLIAGVSKAGTTSLFRYLSQHPDICPATVKEVRYFQPLRYGEPMEPLESYLQHFAHCGAERYRTEATPGYFAGGDVVAGAVQDLLPGARVIVSFRDPVQRCWSWYRFVRSSARIPREMGFAEYVDRCEDLHRDGLDGTRANQPFWGLGGGCYDTWFVAWSRTFGDRLRIEFFERIVQDPRAVVDGLCDWLDIDPTVCGDFRYAVENRTVQYKNKRLQKAALFVNRRSERFFTRRPALKRALRSVYYVVNGDRSESRMDPAVRQRLEDFYAPHNERLAYLLTAAGVADQPAWVSRHSRV